MFVIYYKQVVGLLIISIDIINIFLAYCVMNEKTDCKLLHDALRALYPPRSTVWERHRI